MFSGIQILELGALPLLLQFDHKSSSSDDLTLQQMEKRENAYRKRVCKFCTGLACEQAFHLGDIVKSRRARHARGDAKAGVLLDRAFSRSSLN